MRAQPYLNFDGRCEEALNFYRSAVGAEVTMLMRFKDSPDVKASPDGCAPGMIPPGAENKVMHCSFRIGDTELMASDAQCGGKPNFQGISLALSVPNDAEAKRRFATLGDGGQVQMPLTKTFFASSFGMVADRFGVSWMIVVGP